VGGTAQTRRGRVVVNSPSYSQAGGIFRTYFGQEWVRPLKYSSEPDKQAQNTMSKVWFITGAGSGIEIYEKE